MSGRRSWGRRCATPSHTATLAASRGNFQSYVEDLRKRKDPDADHPHRIAQQKLVRA
jgi:hypothetical protein